MTPKMHNSKGEITRYALACGYTDTRWNGNYRDGDACVRMEQIYSNGTLRVVASGRWLRKEVYCGSSLRDARAAFRGFPLAEQAEAAKP
jgi:hypothetical protein